MRVSLRYIVARRVQHVDARELQSKSSISLCPYLAVTWLCRSRSKSKSKDKKDRKKKSKSKSKSKKKHKHSRGEKEEDEAVDPDVADWMASRGKVPVARSSSDQAAERSARVLLYV